MRKENNKKNSFAAAVAVDTIIYEKQTGARSRQRRRWQRRIMSRRALQRLKKYLRARAAKCTRPSSFVIIQQTSDAPLKTLRRARAQNQRSHAAAVAADAAAIAPHAAVAGAAAVATVAAVDVVARARASGRMPVL